jgi:hypothetical protein
MPRWATALNFVIRLSRRAVELKRTRISYIAEPPKATYAAFRKESRTKLANATKLDRKPGGA